MEQNSYEFSLKSTYNLMNIGKTHQKVRNIYNINNNRKPNPNNWVVLASYDSIKKALNQNLKVDYFVVCPELATSSEVKPVLESLSKKTKEGYLVSKKTYEYFIDKHETFGIMALVKFPILSLEDVTLKKDMRIVIMDGVEVQGNAGTIIRSADGAGVDLAIFTNKRIRLTHPKFIRSSMGTCFYVPLVVAEMEEVISWLEKHDVNIYLTDTRANQSYNQVEYSGRVAIVAGSEKYGIMKRWYDAKNVTLIKLPMLGYADSLNVGVSTSIIMYQSIV